MRLAVLGDPIAHSLSPVIHRAFLDAAGIAGSYDARLVDAHGMIEALAEVRSGVLDGANVTMPHKQLAAASCDRLSSVASRTGAVNTLVRVGDEVVGHNTDVNGVRSAWSTAGLPDGARVVVLGAGGAAAAALVALEGRRITVQARDTGRAEQVIRSVGVEADVARWGAEAPGSVVVNATPVGRDGARLPLGIESCAGLLDMAYGEAASPAVEAARLHGIPVSDGVDMLIAQAAESFRLWTGVVVDPATASEAVRRFLGARNTA